MGRKGTFERRTAETEVLCVLDLDGEGKAQVDTGIGFFDHMLELLSRHSLIDLELRAKGDLEVDYHHTVEDVGIALGEALKAALGQKEGIRRYGWAIVPMDEALVLLAVDLSGRPYLGLEDRIEGTVGGFDLELLEVFLSAFVTRGEMTLHARVLSGRNKHHVAEALFKGLALALREAVQRDPRRVGIPSTKGVL